MHKILQQLPAAINACMSCDQHSFHQSLRRVLQAAKLQADKPSASNTAEAVEKQLALLTSSIEASQSRSQQRRNSIPPLNFPDTLPVSQRREEIAEAIEHHQVVIVAGETGSGKTTQLPKICLQLGRGTKGFIGHTQPRRIAARSVAARIAEELNTPLGEAVGFKVRFSDHTQASSLIKLMTDGMLLAELQTDRYLAQYDTLIVDEAHERSLNIDFLLGYLKQLLPKRPDLKVIITSATIDTERFSKHFDNAPVITVSGRSYPVEIRYQPAEDDEADLNQRITAAIDELVQHDNSQQLRGDVLVFLSGEREIRELAEALRKHHPAHTDILPLYSRQSANEQNRVFKQTGRRRIILATNVAETSLTVPGIRYVVDPGTARISRYSYRSKVQRLPVEPIAQSSANQRAGRCGRLSDGICIRLYSETDFKTRPEFTQPEIQRTNLAAVILQMRQLRLGDPDQYPFIDPPDSRFINDGFRLLLELGAIDEKRKLTQIGNQLARLPIDPRLGRMVLAAEELNCLNEVLLVVSALSVQDPRERPVDKQQKADEQHKQFLDESSDFVALLNLWENYADRNKHLTQNKLRQYCKQHFLSYTRLRDWSETYLQLRSLVKGMGLKINTTPAAYPAIHQSLLSGLLGNIGVKREPDDSQPSEKRKNIARYLGARNTEFLLFPGSGLAKKSPTWVMSAELVETSRLFARHNARIEPEWIESTAQHLVKRNYSEPHWSEKQGSVKAYETVSLYGLILQARRSVHYGPINPPVSRELFIREALVQGNYRTQAAFFAHNQALFNEARQLESKTRRPDVLVDDETLFRFFDRHIPATVFSHASFEKWRKKIERKSPDILRLSREDVFSAGGASPNADYPGEIRVNNAPFKLRYCFSPGEEDDGVTVVIPLGALNQLDENAFAWLVPGFIAEKVTALLKGLPKSVRKQLVPIPEFSERVVHKLQDDFKRVDCAERDDLIGRLSQLIKAEKQIPLKASDWRPELLPEHLRMRFSVLDHNGKELGAGRSLKDLQRRFSARAAGEIKQLAVDVKWPESGVTDWQFGDLPESVEVDRGGHRYLLFPAVVDKQDSVGVELMDSLQRAQDAQRAGLRRLVTLCHAKEVKYVMRNLPAIDSMCLIYSTLGSCEDLKQGLLNLILTRSFFSEMPEHSVRTEQQFLDCLKRGKPLMSETKQLCQMVADILAAYQTVIQRFKQQAGTFPVHSRDDVREQLAGLMPTDFLHTVPVEWLQHLPRYLQALDARLQKLSAAPAGDAEKLAQIRPLAEAYLRLCGQANAVSFQAELSRLKWMLEEFRVSLFAQPLKTSMPISARRIEKQIAICS
ncbi:MAG: ATP-dependent RNA helicase HrpA [Gammaproteobacteria bacterium]|nr:ATP-dependent RNA helicase HrpA [Gammaproteobacteria bacterium]